MKLLVVIPAFNEEENLPRVISELREKVPQYDFVIINDGSTDGTEALCRAQGYPFLDLPANLGLTGAFQTGVRYACEMGYDAVIQIDGDAQHDPAYIPDMAALMEEKDLDLVIGSRFVTEKRPATMRMAGNALISWAIRVTTGKTVMDPTSGMRLYGRRVLKELAVELNARPEPDTVAQLLRGGARMEEYQVRMREREKGESYLDFGASMLYMVQMCMNIFFLQWVMKKESQTCPGQ